MNHNDLDVKDLFPSRYIKASDLDGDDLVLTITSLSKEPMGQNNETKPVLFFKEINKGLVLNKTNALVIAQLYGSKVPDWFGQPIALYVTEVPFAGKTTWGVRVRLRKPDIPDQPRKRSEDEILKDMGFDKDEGDPENTPF